MSSLSKYKDVSKYKDLAKDKASNLKGGVKGKVNGVLGRKQSNTLESDHVAAPLSTLRDPNSFAPPPKRTDSGLAPPPPPGGPRKVIPPPSKMPLDSNRLLEAPPDEVDDGPPPPQPYRMNTTGLSTDHLPRPPTMRTGGAGERSPPSYDSTMKARRAPQAPGPSLPPRLPPRSNSHSPERSSSPGTLNQGAVGRLGAAGMSVPAFGIHPSHSHRGDDEGAPPPKPPRPSASQAVDALSNRFAKMSPSPLPSANAAAPPSEGTTWAQKQAAFKTASAFRKDPSSVSFGDAKAAASVANNFRQRHGHQVAAGLEAANTVNQKYGVADTVGTLSAQQQSGGPRSSASSIASSTTALAGKKKPPPPPPPKKPSLAGDAVPSSSTSLASDGDAPPPIPFATRPTF